LSTTNSYQIIVNEVNIAPVLAAIDDQIVDPGLTVSFTAIATDADAPTNTLTFSLISPPAGAIINPSSGIFTWRAGAAYANTTNLVQVNVTDDGSPNLSDTKSLAIVVNPIVPVVLTPVAYTNRHFVFSVSGSAGPDYIIMASSNLTTWSDMFTNVAPVPPFQFIGTNIVGLHNQYYRVRLSP
jgi:hypothetical protein